VPWRCSAKNNAFKIQIASRPQKDDWCVARCQSGFLSATYSVEFANSIAGAIALPADAGRLCRANTLSLRHDAEGASPPIPVDEADS